MKSYIFEGTVVQSVGPLLSMVGRMINNPPPPNAIIYHYSLVFGLMDTLDAPLSLSCDLLLFLLLL